jgi:hypothetical protein
MSESIEQQAQRAISDLVDYCTLSPSDVVEDAVSTIRALLAELARVKQENIALRKEVGRPTGGRICPQDGGVCWEERCDERFCEIQTAEASLAAVRAALEEIEQEMRAKIWMPAHSFVGGDGWSARWADRLAALRLGKDGE